MKYRSKVIETFYRSADVLSISFQKPKDFRFSPGQFLFLKIRKEDQELVKHFTISSSPTENFLQITKKLTGHEYSNALLNLEIKDEVEIDGPYGNFTYAGSPMKVLFITGGIGITPIHSMIKYCTDIDIDVDVILLYSCRYEENILYRTEFEQIMNNFTGLKIHYTLTRPEKEWNGLSGRINSSMIQKHVPDYKTRLCYVCGPPNMVEVIESILINELKIDKSNIKKENFLGL